MKQKWLNSFNYDTENNVEILFCPVLPDIRKKTAFLEGFQTSPACPYDKNTIEASLSTENWRNVTESGEV